MFTLQDQRKVPWHRGEKPTPVVVYSDMRGDRHFYIHPSQVFPNRYDIRIVAQGQATADQANVSGKQVERTARTLGIDLTEDRLELLTRSTARRVARQNSQLV
jgi:hypothetical protein